MKSWSFLAAVILFAFRCPASAVVLGQLDDFQDGTPGHWMDGGVAPAPMNIANGGPLGAGDRYLQLTADGAGAGSRLTIFNFQQWIGNDYVSAGITGIEIDLLNQGSVPLSIRLAFQPAAVNGFPGYLSSAMLLPVGSGWQHFSISFVAGNLIPVAGPAPFNTFYNDGKGWVRIINEAGTSNLNGDIVVSQLGIDNIHAVPEPHSGAFLAVGLLVLTAQAIRARRRRHAAV
ncbi:MAG: hypothetical protein ACR2HH_17210 [Chthoniobacterales bacterium]